MSENLVYLKNAVYFEPLVNHWYAWPYLIPPVQASRYIANSHIRIMRSFIKDYKLHILANNETILTGGEFLDCTEDQLEDIQGLIDEFERDHGDVYELSSAVKELDNLIRTHVSGESIEYLYKDIPTRLKGYIEIFMDLNHNPTYRLLEHLLYESPNYKRSMQSASFGTLDIVEERPFAFSTPRLADKNHIQVHLSFESAELDQILASRVDGIAHSKLSKIFAPDRTIGGLDYHELFTDQKPAINYKSVSGGLRLRFFGHACFLVESSDVSILIDPIIATKGPLYSEEVFSFDSLPPVIDYVCITHNHQDHMNLEALLQIRKKTKKVIVPRNNGGSLADPSMKLILKQLRFDVIEVDDFDEILLPKGKITAIPFLGEHGDLNVRSKTVWHIELGEKRVLFGADATNCDPEMYKHIQRLLGDVDILALGMECVGAPYTWLYGALNTQTVSKKIRDSRRLNGANADQAFQIVKIFNPKEVFIYAMGMEPWYKYFMGVDYADDSEQIVQSNKLIELCRPMGIPATRLSRKAELQY